MITLPICAKSFSGEIRKSDIIVVQQARELGINISFRDFARLGVPVALTALGGLLAWLALVSWA